MKQTKDEIEKFYEDRDPWDYITTDDDAFRRSHILYVCSLSAPDRILEIGSGEGFITRGLLQICADIDAIEISETASARMPKIVNMVDRPSGKYDLVLAAGVLYDHYDWETMKKWINDAKAETIVTCHYDQVGIPHDRFEPREQTFYMEFPYRDGQQVMRVYR